MVPADERRVARGDDTSWPRIDPACPVASTGPETEPRSMFPAFVCAVTYPDRDWSRISPALLLTRTVIAFGTVMSLSDGAGLQGRAAAVQGHGAGGGPVRGARCGARKLMCSVTETWPEPLPVMWALPACAFTTSVCSWPDSE